MLVGASLFIALGTGSTFAAKRKKVVKKRATGKMIVIKNESPPKSGATYFAFWGTTEPEIKGTLSLNGKQIYDFDEKGSQISSNEPQDLLKVGPNIFVLNILHVGNYKAPSPSSSRSHAFMGRLHGLDEPGFPDESNVIGRWQWDPDLRKKNPVQLRYVFNLKKRNPIKKPEVAAPGAPLSEEVKKGVEKSYLELAKYFKEKSSGALSHLQSHPGGQGERLWDVDFLSNSRSLEMVWSGRS